MQSLTPEQQFEEIIGYKFKDISLLKRALTHSSYANENRLKPLSDNERTEFLGDAVLEIVVSEFLFLNYPDKREGEMTRLRASIVCEPTLAYCASQIRLGEFIFLSRGEEKTGGRQRKSVVSDAMEAVIGAIYLDGGMEPASAYIHKFILTDIEHKLMFSDSKTLLQEMVQARYKTIIHYELLETTGPDHARTFTVAAMLDDKPLSKGVGSNKKSAEQEAAYKALLKLKGESTNSNTGSKLHTTPRNNHVS